MAAKPATGRESTSCTDVHVVYRRAGTSDARHSGSQFGPPSAAGQGRVSSGTPVVLLWYFQWQNYVCSERNAGAVEHCISHYGRVSLAWACRSGPGLDPLALAENHWQLEVEVSSRYTDESECNPTGIRVGRLLT